MQTDAGLWTLKCKYLVFHGCTVKSAVIRIFSPVIVCLTCSLLIPAAGDEKSVADFLNNPSRISLSLSSVLSMLQGTVNLLSKS